MNNKPYSKPEQAIARIEKNGGQVGGKVIEIENPGLKVIGAISYLVNFHGFRWAEHNPGNM